MTIKPVLWLLISIGVVTINTACTCQSQGYTNQPGSESTVSSKDLLDTESWALSDLAEMMHEQISIYGTQAQFSRTGSDFKGRFPPATQDYSYQIVQVTPTKVYMTATAHQANLRSLSAQIFVLPAASRARGNGPIRGSICVTNTSSQQPPAEPADATVAEPPCPSGSSSMVVMLGPP